MIKQFYLCFRLSIFRSGACAGIALTGLMYSHAGIAQSVVTGQVISDDDRAPLAGVSVIEKGTNNGTVTDSNGKYQITVKGASSVLTSRRPRAGTTGSALSRPSGSRSSRPSNW